MTEPGQVYIGKLRNRGGGRDPVIPNVKNINVTSGSNNKINGYSIKNLSPLYIGPVIEKDIFGHGNLVADIFENYWQYGKVFEELGHVDDDGNITRKWREFRSKGYHKKTGDRHPVGTKTNEVKYVDDRGRNWYRYMTPIFGRYLATNMDYIESRKRIYVPVYEYLLENSETFQALQDYVDEGHDVQILDLDGPVDADPDGQRVTKKYLRKKINDPSANFGHGYVAAALLSGIKSEDYT